MNKTYLGIDWGEKRIGLAIGHSETGIALPLKTCSDIADIIHVLRNEDVDEIVIGEPRKKASGKYRVSQDFNAFIDDLKGESGLPVILVDEFLTSKAADSLSGNKKEKASRDELSAMIILQTYLDSL